MPDITNYAYLWYRNDNPLSEISPRENNIIYKIVTTFSYPCYLSGADIIRSLLPEDKNELLHNEIGFIRKRIQRAGLSHIHIIQIPRVLYDLFSLIYSVEKKTRIYEIMISCEEDDARSSLDDFILFEDYVRRIGLHMKEVKYQILALNSFIMDKIHYIANGGPPLKNYDMPKSSRVRCSRPFREPKSCPANSQTNPEESTDDNSRSSSSSSSSSSSRSPASAPASESQKPPKNHALVLEFLSDTNKAFQKILQHILRADRIYFPKIHTSLPFFLNFSPKTKDIIRQVLQFELRNSSGYTILYRGAVLDNDALIASDGHIQSISFNTSLLSGCVNDDTACTLFYMEETASEVESITQPEINDKIKYTIKKFMKDDASNEDSLFFIPPIHPFLQLYSKGELFHPRTKLSERYLHDVYPGLSEKNVGGIFCGYGFLTKCNYLQSVKPMEELNALYHRYKATSIIDKWYSNPKHQEEYERSRSARAAISREAAARGKTLRAFRKSALNESRKFVRVKSAAMSPSSSRSSSSASSSRSTGSVKRLKHTSHAGRRRTCKRMKLR